MQGLQQVNMAVETFVQQNGRVLLMRNDLRVRDVLAYFIICQADLSLIKLTFLQKLMLGVAGNTCERSANSCSVSSDCFSLPNCGDNFNYIFVFCFQVYLCLQCFDAVGWAAGRASGL